MAERNWIYRLTHHRLLERVVQLLEWVVAVLLVVMTAMGVLGLVMLMLDTVKAGGALKAENYLVLVDATLIVFIVVELFRIAVSYMRHEAVVPTVMEAALVAVARKFVIFDPTVDGMQLLLKGVGLSVLLLAVALAWWLLRHSSNVGPRKRHDHEDEEEEAMEV
jgi:uncharacterized membrane protein (DUF373 family)